MMIRIYWKLNGEQAKATDKRSRIIKPFIHTLSTVICHLRSITIENNGPWKIGQIAYNFTKFQIQIQILLPPFVRVCVCLLS